MKSKNLICAGLAISLFMTSIVCPVYAESFATPADLLTDVITTSVTGISSSTMSEALSYVQGRISVDGDAVKYNGSVIGYWYADSADTLFATDEKTDTVIEPVEGGYKVSPGVLHTLLADLNDQLVENYVPTSEDWTKIVGKYDITLGGITIPAEQWLPADLVPESDTTFPDKRVNLSTETGLVGYDAANTQLGAMAWVIDENNQLYVQGGITMLTKNANAYGTREYSLVTRQTNGIINSSVIVNHPFISAVLTSHEMTNNDDVYVRMLVHNAVGTDFYWHACGVTDSYKLYSVENPATQFIGKIDQLKAYGLVYLKGAQLAEDLDEYTQWNNFKHMFDSYSCGKLVRGNTKLTKRLEKLMGLLESDTLKVKSSGWYINDSVDIDSYLGSQQIINSGDSADIAAIAEVASLQFKVIVPTTLPIYIDEANQTYVADNATITNKSGAAVKITGVDIIHNANSGWTPVDDSPSNTLDAKEYKFGTTIAIDTEMAIDEVYPFTYDAQLSPTAEGTAALELATVKVTVDWA